MLLTGTFVRSLDDKQRLAVPKLLRDALGFPSNSVFYLAPGTDGSLALFAEPAFDQLADRLGQSSPNRQNVRAFSRLFYAQAQRVEADRQGRVRIPVELAQLAGLAKEVVLIGVRDHLEIWNRARWEQYLVEQQSRYDEIAESAFEGRGVPTSEAAGNQHEQSTEAGDRPLQPR